MVINGRLMKLIFIMIREIVAITAIQRKIKSKSKMKDER